MTTGLSLMSFVVSVVMVCAAKVEIALALQPQQKHVPISDRKIRSMTLSLLERQSCLGLLLQRLLPSLFSLDISHDDPLVPRR